VLSGTATKTAATLSGQIAVTWPASSGLSPSIVPVGLDGANGQYSLGGTVSAGAGAGLELNSAYARVSAARANGGTLQHINGDAPFAIYVNGG
jgi:hypothetical protein